MSACGARCICCSQYLFLPLFASLLVVIVVIVVIVVLYHRSSRVEVTRAVLNQGKRFVAVMALDTGDET